MVAAVRDEFARQIRELMGQVAEVGRSHRKHHPSRRHPLASIESEFEPAWLPGKRHNCALFHLWYQLSLKSHRVIDKRLERNRHSVVAIRQVS
jgi:hypothetical protein